jgi:hypothetical protein
MSVVTGRNGLKISIPDGVTTGEYPGFTRTFNPLVTMTKSVDGSDLTVITASRLAGGIYSIVWNGITYCFSTDHGTGLQFAYQCTPYELDGAAFSINNNSGLFFAPTEEGNQQDGNSQHLCSSDLLETWVRADGLSVITTVNPTFWGKPDSVNTPTPYNVRRLSSWTTTCERQIGYGGNDHIIRSTNSLTFPPFPELSQFDWIQLSDLTMYFPIADFSVCRKVNPADGTTVIATPPGPGDIEYNQTQPYLWENAGGTAAGGVYIPPSSIGPLGFYCARYGPLTSNTFAFRCPAQQVGGVQPLPETVEAFYCYGDRADVIAAFQQLYLDFP